MPLVTAAILPHGWNLIPELDPTAAGAMATTRSMQAVGDHFRELGVESIVIAGPHGMRVRNHMALYDVARIAGSLTLGNTTVDLNVPVDRRLLESIEQEARTDGIPIGMMGFAGNRADQAVAPLDWGFMVPLWFLHNGNQHQQGTGSVLSPAPETESVPPVVAITPARGLSRQQQIAFGQSIGRAIHADPRRIAFVASCDWSHVHQENGPYGYDPIGVEVDALITEAIRKDTLHELQLLSQESVDRAAIDGLWQTLILAGLRDIQPLPTSNLLSYEVPSYFGMIVARFDS